MNTTRNWIIGIGTALGLALAATGASAHPGPAGGDGQQGMHGGEHHAMHGGMGHGRHGAKGPHAEGRGEHGARGGFGLMTPEERTALRDKMRAAKTPEERRQIALANRTEMEKRAKEKGITLPERRGPHGRHGGGAAATPPAATEQAR